MERLTVSRDGVAWYKTDLMLLEPCDLTYPQVGEVLRRLASYEDTGLTPEEITALRDKCSDQPLILRLEASVTAADLQKFKKSLAENRLISVLPMEGEE